MHEELLSKITSAISTTVKEKRIGLAFSGGVDSSLLAKICSNLGYDTTLLTIGFADSHDILFAKNVNKNLNLKHEILEIDPSEFNEISTKVNHKIKTKNLSWNENSIAFYYVAKLAQSIDIKNVITANGIDELFCGYNAYREIYPNGEKQIIALMESKLDNELKMMKAVNDVTSEFGVNILQPLLSDEFISYAKKIPLDQKIRGKDDLLRKHAIRELALDIGVPKISAEKRKKALQYGTLIHKTLLKSR
jgi:asparagine synthase (glutamine-hydrolysing)